MTRDDIIRITQEAGIVVTGEAVWKLCEIVAAAEREACAKLCEKQINGNHYESLANRGYWDHMAQSALNCAAAIRARG